MGSSLSQQLCCVVCERCREQEAAKTEPSETKPILQSPGDTRTFLDTQSPTPALKVPTRGSKELSQGCQHSPDALEENGEPCSAAQGWEAAWNPLDFFVAPADEEAEGEDSTQQEKMGKAEEEKKPVADVPVGDTALGAELAAEEEQPGPEGAPCAGITLQEGNLSPTELQSEAEPGQGCETERPAEPTGILLGSDLVLCAMQVAEQPGPLEATGRAKAAGTSPHPAQRAELTSLVEAMSLLTLQSPAKVIASGVAELCSTSPVSWEPLCPQWGSLEPPKHLLELLKKGSVSPARGPRGSVSPARGSVSPAWNTQGSVSPARGLRGSVSPARGLRGSMSPAQGLHGNVSPSQGMEGSVSPAGPSELLQQPQHGALCELGSRGCTPAPEEEPQQGILQPALELPEESAAFVPVPVRQEAEFPPVGLSLPEGLGSRGEIEAENAEA